MSNPDNLREKYRENASLFLHLASQVSGKNEGSKSHSQKRQIFNPLSTSKSLALRSRYDDTLYESTDGMMLRSKCISQSGMSMSLDVANLIRSGGKSKPVTLDLEKCQNTINSLSSDKESIIDHFQNQIKNNSTTKETIKQLSKQLSNNIVLPTIASYQHAVHQEFHCSSCGSNMLPVHSYDKLGASIRIKSLSRSSSMRRRASRYVAKRCNFEGNIMKKQHGGGRTFSNTSNSHGAAVSNVMNTLVALKKNHAQHRVYDGLAKNIIVFKCNTCTHEKIIKGAPLFGKSKEGNGGTETIQTGKSQSSHQEEKNFQTENSIPLQKEKDFLSFQLTSATRCLPNKPKKKRKKLDTQKKSGLQDFLSSLND